MNDSFLHQLNTNSTKISESELCCFVYLVGMTRFALLSRSFEQSEIRTFDTKQAEQKRSACFRTSCRDDKIRTCDLRSPRPLRYRTAPHPAALRMTTCNFSFEFSSYTDGNTRYFHRREGNASQLNSLSEFLYASHFRRKAGAKVRHFFDISKFF